MFLKQLPMLQLWSIESPTVAHKVQCNKKDRMQAKKIGCKQKNQNLSRCKLYPRPADTITFNVLQTSNYDPEVVMD